MRLLDWLYDKLCWWFEQAPWWTGVIVFVLWFCLKVLSVLLIRRIFP